MLLSKTILKAGLYWEDFYRNLWPVRNMMVLSLEQWGKYGDGLNNFPVVCHPHITLMSQEPWDRNSRVCNQVAEVCMPVLTQECLRWEGVHKISLTFITVNNILSGVVRGFLGLVFFFFSSVEFQLMYLVMVLPEKLWELARVQVPLRFLNAFSNYYGLSTYMEDRLTDTVKWLITFPC